MVKLVELGRSPKDSKVYISCDLKISNNLVHEGEKLLDRKGDVVILER